MSKKISNNDLRHILTYYNIPIPKSTTKLKMMGAEILAEKLCRCIKKIPGGNEKKAIGICTRSVFNKKGFRRGTFKCRGKATVNFTKITPRNKTVRIKMNK